MSSQLPQRSNPDTNRPVQFRPNVIAKAGLAGALAVNAIGLYAAESAYDTEHLPTPAAHTRTVEVPVGKPFDGSIRAGIAIGRNDKSHSSHSEKLSPEASAQDEPISFRLPAPIAETTPARKHIKTTALQTQKAPGTLTVTSSTSTQGLEDNSFTPQDPENSSSAGTGEYDGYSDGGEGDPSLDTPDAPDASNTPDNSKPEVVADPTPYLEAAKTYLTDPDPTFSKYKTYARGTLLLPSLKSKYPITATKPIYMRTEDKSGFVFATGFAAKVDPAETNLDPASLQLVYVPNSQINGIIAYAEAGATDIPTITATGPLKYEQDGSGQTNGDLLTAQGQQIGVETLEYQPRNDQAYWPDIAKTDDTQLAFIPISNNPK